MSQLPQYINLNFLDSSDEEEESSTANKPAHSHNRIAQPPSGSSSSNLDPNSVPFHPQNTADNNSFEQSRAQNMLPYQSPPSHLHPFSQGQSHKPFANNYHSSQPSFIPADTNNRGEIKILQAEIARLHEQLEVEKDAHKNTNTLYNTINKNLKKELDKLRQENLLLRQKIDTPRPNQLPNGQTFFSPQYLAIASAPLSTHCFFPPQIPPKTSSKSPPKISRPFTPNNSW